MIGIYKITNIKNNKIYIGKSNNIEQRFQQHKFAIQNSNSSWYPEARQESTSINDFYFEVLQQCNEQELDELEEYWINFYNSHVIGYNKKFASQGITITTDNYIQSDNNQENNFYIQKKIFTKINEKISGKSGNMRTLLLYLIMLINQNVYYLPPETEILNMCSMSHSRYVEARKALAEMKFIDYRPGINIQINFSTILE